MNDQQIIGSSYLINFYQETQSLNHAYATYLNLILELEAKYGEEQKLTPEENDILKQTLQTVRHYAHKTHIAHQTITKSTNQPENKKITELYQKINQKFVIDITTLEEYTLQLNQYLLAKPIQKLLTTSDTILKKIYQNGNNTTNTTN